MHFTERRQSSEKLYACPLVRCHGYPESAWKTLVDGKSYVCHVCYDSKCAYQYVDRQGRLRDQNGGFAHNSAGELQEAGEMLEPELRRYSEDERGISWKYRYALWHP